MCTNVKCLKKSFIFAIKVIWKQTVKSSQFFVSDFYKMKFNKYFYKCLQEPAIKKRGLQHRILPTIPLTTAPPPPE